MMTDKTNNSSPEQMASIGAQFAFIKSRRHPSAGSFIFGMKNKIEIFDLEKTKQKLDEALAFVAELSKTNAKILLVGGKSEAKASIEMAAHRLNMPYVSGRFIGGSLTNFKEIRKRVDKMEKLLDEKEKGELAKYTKKERLLIDREIDKLKEYFSGLSTMKDLPQAVFVVDSKQESIAVKEASMLGIPVIAICGSDNDMSKVAYPIPANDSSKKSIEFFVNQIAEAYQKASK